MSLVWDRIRKLQGQEANVRNMQWLGRWGSARRRVHSLIFAALAAVGVGGYGLAPVPMASAQGEPWMDAKMPVEERVNALLPQMTLEEKIAMVHGRNFFCAENPQTGPYVGCVPGNERLHIPSLRLDDGPQGAARKPFVTEWPAPVAAAATFDVEAMYRYGAAMGREQWVKGVNVVLAPMANIVRVPEAGRNFETFGEDPFLAARMAVASVRGLQDNGPIATVKHYAANNQENNRDNVSANVDSRTMHEIYLPAFEAAIKEGRAGAVMCSYNKVNGIYACENPALLTRYLRDEFGFDGFVMSDWGATHSTIPSALAGLDMEMPGTSYYGDGLKSAVQEGKVPMKVLDEMVRRILRQMLRFGLFDKPQTGNHLTPASNPDHQGAAREIAEQGTVLLKNDGGLLPLSTETLSTLAVIGPSAVNIPAGGGSAMMFPTTRTPPLAGIETRVAGTNVKVVYNDGSNPTVAAQVAALADAAVVFVNDSESEGADRSHLSLQPGACTLVTCIDLPGNYDELIGAVAEANPRTAVVVNTGAPVLMPWVNKVPAILEAWYPGQEAGPAIAAILFGDVDPGGRLPVSFPRERKDVPTNTQNRYPGVDNKQSYDEGVFMGYRHYDAKNIKPLFPFGHGLSYTTFRYDDLRIEPGGSNAVATVSLRVTNTGKRAGWAVPQLYLRLPVPRASVQQPPRQLKGFDNAFLRPGQSTTVTFPLDERAFSYWDTAANGWRVAPGCYAVMVGASSRDLPLRGTISRGGASCGSGSVVLGKRIAAAPRAPVPAGSLPATGVAGGAILGVVLLAGAIFMRRILTRAAVGRLT